MRVLFCDQYDNLGNCIGCKWNQIPDDTGITGNDNRDPHKTIYTDAERLKLDFGLYRGKCYDNTGSSWDNSNKIENCAKYNDDANPKCIECHSKWYDMQSNTEWQAPGTQNALSWFRKIHLDYYLSEDSTGVFSCKRYPANYVGLPVHLKKIENTVADNKFIITKGDNTLGFLCKPTFGSKELVKINACGTLITTACAGGEAGDGYYLCAEKENKCLKYKVEDMTSDRWGNNNQAKPSFWYKIAKKCV